MNPIKNFNERISKLKKIKTKILEITKKHGSPLYIYDAEEAKKNIKLFKDSFKKHGVDANIYYATKSNSYVGLLKTVTQTGEGIDVSSQMEMKLALKAGSKKIIYTGPAKLESDFELILKHNEKVIVNLDSLRELYLLDKVARKHKKIVKCGIRIYTAKQSGWTKFGIPLDELRKFYNEAKKCKNISLEGIHFHISFNIDEDKYSKTLEDIADYFVKNFEKSEYFVKFIDIGGGFYPAYFGGDYVWNEDGIMCFDTEQIFENILANKYNPRFSVFGADHMEKSAEITSKTWKEKIIPLFGKDTKLIAEPGKFICNSVMHFLFTMIEVKRDWFGIVDGGNNMAGWEVFQYMRYSPIFNLSQFDTNKERVFVTYGSLCTPEDIWGYYLYSKNVPKNGDIFVMPYQGEYTYSIAQNFIREIPKVIELG